RADRLDSLADRGGGEPHRVALVADGDQVPLGEPRRASPSRPYATLGHRSRKDDQKVAAHGRDGVLDGGLRPLADREHGDDSRDADDDPQRRENRPHEIPLESLEGDDRDFGEIDHVGIRARTYGRSRRDASRDWPPGLLPPSR